MNKNQEYVPPTFSIKANRLLLTGAALAFAAGAVWLAVLAGPWLLRTALTWY